MDFSVALSWVLARLLIGGVPPRDHRPRGAALRLEDGLSVLA